MKKITLLLITLTLFLTGNMLAQTSPDYIFGNDNGAGWSWTTGTQGTASLGGSYKWQFAATASTDHYFKFGETSSNSDGEGFWTNNAVSDMQYTGAGAKWTAYYQANMGGGGAIYTTITSGNYYVIKAKKQSGNDIDFAVFDNGAQAPVTITSVARTFSSPNLLVDVTLSGTKSSNEKVWVRYTTNNWTSSSTVEASVNTSGNIWEASIPLSSGDLVMYYAYTTIQQSSAPAEADADFFTINYNNNSGVNYTYKNGSMSGTFYVGNNGTAPGGTNPDFNYLRQACDAINTATISGDCTFYFTSDLNEPTNVDLGVNTNGHSITFKPYSATTVSLNFQDGTTSQSIDGHFVIGSPSHSSANLVQTDNIIIDGSNSEGGTSKDLTINGPVTSFQRSVIRIFGNNNNIVIKNCIIINNSSSSNSTAPIQCTNYNASSVNYTPDNITINNNTLSSIAGNGGLGIYLSNSGTPTIGMSGIVISNNIITHRGTRGIMCNYVNDANIYGNSISANMQLASGAGAGIWLSTGTSNAGTFNIYNNHFSSLLFLNNTGGASNGYIAIDNQFASPKIVNIYNNFITGFSPTSSVSNSKIYGIRHTGSSTSYIYFNTIVLPEMTNMTTFGSSYIAGIAFATAATTEASPAGTINIKNNLIISNETTMKVWGIRRVGTNGTFNSDYNDIYYDPSNVSAYIGYWNDADKKSLSDWQTASTKDANSKSKAVNFVSSTDLHLTGSSLGDTDLIGDPSVGITTDIDGQTRHATYPYMGADESITNPLPVELTSFTASAGKNGVVLNWSTATEVNNYGFEIERASHTSTSLSVTEWEKIGFVQGHGNANAPNDYTFTDADVTSGNYQYRLKQIDFDGSVSYSDVVEVAVNISLEKLSMDVYPNPFNPSTTLAFILPKESRVNLSIYDITGQKVVELIDNEVMEAGLHKHVFNASNLASGIYISVLQAEGMQVVKKLQLLK